MIGEIPTAAGNLSYRLDGAADSASAHTLVFINDMLTNLHIWDPLIAELESKYPNYRLLRYDPPPPHPSQTPLTSLSHSLASLLAALSPSPSRTHLVGLGLGASTALSLLTTSTATTTPAASSLTAISVAVPRTPAARDALLGALAERTALARRWGMRVTADKAVAVWMAADARGTAAWAGVRRVVLEAQDDVEGFCAAAAAVAESYGAEEGEGRLGRVAVRALFLAGSGDGVMPEEMATYPGLMNGAEGRFREVKGAGRLFWWDAQRVGRVVEDLVAWIAAED